MANKQPAKMRSGRFRQPLNRSLGHSHLRSPFNGRLLRAGFCLLPLLPIPAHAQQTPPANELLDRIRTTLATSIAALPNLTCTEQVLSQQTHKERITSEKHLNTEIRVTRVSTPDPQTGTTLKELRTLISTDGKVANGQVVSLPLTVYGAFGDDFDRFLNQKFSLCQTATVERGTSPEGQPALKLSVVPTPDSTTRPPCSTVAPGASATLWINPDSAQIIAAQTHMPQSSWKHYKGLSISYDYSLVTLDNRQYMLPQRVEATLSDQKAPEELRYEATYNNCHLYFVSATIHLAPDSTTKKRRTPPTDGSRNTNTHAIQQ